MTYRRMFWLLLPVAVLIVVGALALLPSQETEAALPGWYFAYTWHQYNGTYCGEKVWWCDGSVTTQGNLNCPVRRTHTQECSGGPL